jgi:hypothetical protein
MDITVRTPQTSQEHAGTALVEPEPPAEEQLLVVPVIDFDEPTGEELFQVRKSL